MTLGARHATPTIHHGDCLEVLRSLPDASVDAVVTDPPYALSFMGKAWDSHDTPIGFQAWCQLWAVECLRVLKPGGHLLAFGGTRTWHRLACAVEDAGFEVRDSLAWVYGSGFPKSLNASKALREAGRVCTCSESTTEHDLRDLHGTDVPATVGAADRQGSVLLEGVSQQGAPPAGRAQLPGSEVRAGQSGMEGRRNPEAPAGELQGSAVRPLPAGVPGDGASGRLHHGAPARDGAVDRALPTADRGRESQGSRPVEQREGEPRALPVERGSQARGVWPVCERCAQPIVPDGLGTALKPAFEPIVVARKPLTGTVAGNVLAHGTGALNIDGCRVGDEPIEIHRRTDNVTAAASMAGTSTGSTAAGEFRPGRWPANVILDEDQADALDQQSGITKSPAPYVQQTKINGDVYGLGSLDNKAGKVSTHHGDSGGASRFFYVAKAPKRERPVVDGTAHPTVKPLALMRWLVRLVTPPGGTVLEPFAGSGTTVEACILEGFNVIAIEREADYLPLIQSRIFRAQAAVAVEPEPDLFSELDGEAS